ncbi:hypothetical protein BDV18DRAFT_160657 [Aspergillus unguis]
MPTMNACLACRKVKMKCVASGPSSRCDRCTRKALQCVFREHCRGRKPGVRKSRPENVRTQTNQPGGNDFWSGSDGFQPHGLLSHQAMKGKFSLQNILSVDHGLSDQSRESESIPASDPIILGLVNAHVASSLLEYFMQKINPYISQLDPGLHSFAYLRRSPFLFTAVLAAAAKAFQSTLYPNLHAHAETLFAESFKRGEKSTEIIQAILLLTYWKEPNDTRAWTSVGLAIRMAMDLGWHKLSPGASHKQDLNEIQRRELRNMERTFLVLFVYDRSLSLQTGKPYMIERTALIESAATWWRDDLADPNDRLLCAFVSLRLLAADAFDILTSNPRSPRTPSLLSILDRRIDEWQSKWIGIISSEPSPSPDSTGCHIFLIKFYGYHARLQLFSIPLQEARSHDMNAFWRSYQSACDMVHLVNESSALLYFAQDSIHIMTAYAAIFLIKLLLCAPASITQELEDPAINAIRTAASVFSALSAPQHSSCTLQAQFLERILIEYAKISDSPNPDTSPRPRTSALDTEQSRSRPDSNNSRPALSTPRSSCCNQREPAHESGDQSPGPTARVHPTAVFDRDGAGLGFLFDEDTWDEMFASAGFSVQEGVFFS